MTRRPNPGWIALAFAVALASAPARASTPAASLARCQATVAAEAARLAIGIERAAGKCLGRIAKTRIQSGTADASKAAKTCLRELPKLGDGAGALGAQFAARVADRCDPAAASGVSHSEADVLGTASALAEPIGAADAAALCERAGGDGSVDSIAEWTDCMWRAQRCSALQNLGSRYPRAIGWLDDLRPALLALPASSDAIAALDALRSELDGPDADALPSPECGSAGGAVCGDLVRSGAEACDGADLAGADCASQGFAGGVLGCTPECAFDTATCASENCGNAVREGSEACDGADLGGADCTDQGFAGGTLACQGDCTFDTAACTGSCLESSCPGFGQATANVGCGAAGCLFSCKGDAYDADGDPTDGCEVADVGLAHTTATATFVGSFPCNDGSSMQSIAGGLPSDERAHENPEVLGFDAASGSAPDVSRIHADGGTLCTNDVNLTLTVSGSVSPSCYRLAVQTSNGNYSCQANIGGTCSVFQGSGSYADDTDLFVIVSKTCAAATRDAPTYLVTGHL